MTAEDWNRSKDVFVSALEKSGDARMLYIEDACAGRPDLRQNILDMLQAIEEDTSPLDVPAADRLSGSARLSDPVLAGDVLGRYRILKRIGQGGTSVVYLAEHIEIRGPRRYAVKLISPAFMATQNQRFELECEILANFEHPNIVRILDKGVTENGWPYLIMDFVNGSPIHRYAEEKKLAPPEIVRLVLECCQALDYVHSHHVVHCDLKPNNILVDHSGSPRLLDFGIAKLVEPGSKGTGRTTRGARPMTPEYASPEQLEGKPLTVSTDVYSLGIILYEMLARRLPFEHGERTWAQLAKAVIENDPPSPSETVVSSAPGDRTLRRQLRGDLDKVVLRSIARDPEQRYPTVQSLMADLKAYVAGNPVSANSLAWPRFPPRILANGVRRLFGLA
jgi:serine/threonine protein kinase